MELKLFELEVEMRVRRTMRVKAPNPDTAKAVAWKFLSMAEHDPTGAGPSLSSVLKWTDGREAYRPMPVETLLLDPELVISEPVEVQANDDR